VDCFDDETPRGARSRIDCFTASRPEIPFLLFLWHCAPLSNAFSLKPPPAAKSGGCLPKLDPHGLRFWGHGLYQAKKDRKVAFSASNQI
jgi:hypothetical protein